MWFRHASLSLCTIFCVIPLLQHNCQEANTTVMRTDSDIWNRAYIADSERRNRICRKEEKYR